MLIGNYDYLIKHVSEEEYSILDQDRENILGEYADKINFKYNPDMSCVGLWLRREEREFLVLGSKEVSEEEETLVVQLHVYLEQRLEKIRLPKGKWI